jgi:hypothetical protein
MSTTAEGKAYGAANMTCDKRLQFQISQADAEIEATTWGFADSKRVMGQLDRETYGFILNEPKWFRMEFSIYLIESEAWWVTISIHLFGKTIEQCVIHFCY